MKGNVKTIIAFISGAAIGGTVTAVIMKKRFDQVINQRVDELTEGFTSVVEDMVFEKLSELENQDDSDNNEEIEKKQEEQQIVQDNIADMKKKKAQMAAEKPSINELVGNREKYADVLAKTQHVDYTKFATHDGKEPYIPEKDVIVSEQNINNNKEEKEDISDRPYVISPDEFAEIFEYDTISLTLYSDNVLVDTDDVPVEDVDATVGLDSLSHFGEYEDDSVFVRNDRLKADFEILLDNRKFSEIDKPPIG